MQRDDLTSRHGQWLSPGLRALGLPVTLRVFREWTEKFIGLPVLSFGSGTGLLESFCKEQDPGLTLLCIDPKPLSFLSFGLEKPFTEPDFSSLEEVPDLFVGKCLLYLGWPDPFATPYDYEAVMKMRPVSFLTLLEEHDAAGSDLFLEFLEETEEYVMVRETSAQLPFPNGQLELQLQQWDLVREDTVVNVNCEYESTESVLAWPDSSEAHFFA